MHSPRETTNDFYHNNRHLTVFLRQSSRFDTQEILSILLDPELEEERICKTGLHTGFFLEGRGSHG